ncbi:MAG: SpoIIE family protein phosphatase [Bacteroidales bacterium]|nr:SpoIIE family protein phosphatase [Bacteroidales bacterium]
MKEKPLLNQEVKALTDSLDIDSLVTSAIALGEDFTDSATIQKLKTDVLVTGGFDAHVVIEGEDQDDSIIGPGDEGPFGTYFLLLFLLTLLSYLAGLFYNWRFKRYFKLKRTGREVPDKLHSFCKKQLFHTPVINALILTMPSIIIFIYSLIAIIAKADFEGEAERDLFIQLHYLALVATILEFLFVYYWQKHRVHIRYIDHLFTGMELRKQVFRRKGGKIRNRFLVASGMTTFLPLVIVMVYLILSLTSIKDLELVEISTEQREILIGPWSTIMNVGQESVETEKYEKLFYVNAVDSIVMLVGIGNGIIVSLIYLLLFIKWTNQDITRPVKELLLNIRNTRDGKQEQYTIVRTNDEIGELAEGYNEMTQKIHNYVESISAMNRDLEERVKERTNEVVMQKEEIEAQKEEIEAQLDMATQQRDTISKQKDQILDSIRYAERIQSAILPPVEYLSDYLSDHFILFKPRDIVSGDYYWTTLKDDKLLIAVADCTGHGVPGAFLSMLGISSMNEIVNRNGSIRASQILAQLRDFVINSLHQTGTRGEAQDGIEIALCVIDTRKKTVEYAGANRPLYIIRKNGDDPSPGSDTHRLIQYHADRMPIGIYDQETIPFTNHEIDLKRGDSLYLFSDGYVDQLGGPSRKTFRSRYFRKLLLEIQDHSMEEQKRILGEKLEAWRGEVEQIDDILVMGIKI